MKRQKFEIVTAVQIMEHFVHTKIVKIKLNSDREL